MKTKKKGIASLLAAVMILALALSGCGETKNAPSFAGGIGTETDPYQIATAEQLAMVRDDLDACYVLTADIDLVGAAWEPIGTMEPSADDENGETPVLEKAFSGTFDGAGHTISNYTLDGSVAVGLFGTVASGTVQDLTVENVTASVYMMSAAVVGYLWHGSVDNVDLAGTNTVTGVVSDGAAPNMVAGIVGAGMESTVTGCDVSGTTLTVETLPDAAALAQNVHDTGLVGGGLEGCTLTDCTASHSSVTVDGPYCFGIGGLAGCAMSAPSVTGCAATGVTVTVGDNAYLVGGLLGYTGTNTESLTDVSGCTVTDAAIEVGKNAARIGGLVGGGFYLEVYAEYFPNPTSFSLTDCVSSGAISALDSTAVGGLVGYSYLSPVSGCSSDMTLNGSAAQLLGEDAALANH